MRQLLTMAGIMHNRVGGSESKGDLISILAYTMTSTLPIQCTACAETELLAEQVYTKSKAALKPVASLRQ